MAETVIREAAMLTFQFKFVNQYGLPEGLLPKSGSVTRAGLILDGNLIFYNHIYRIERYKRKIVVVLMPFSIVGKTISKHFYPGYPSFIIRVRGFAEEVQSIINRRISTAKANDLKRTMTTEEIKRNFKKQNCPHCDAAINLTYVPITPYIYCEYCETIFDYYGNLLPGGNTYRICPEIGLYDRVAHYVSQTFYVQQKKVYADYRHFICSDTYMHLLFEKNFLKNLLFIFGAITNGYHKIRSLVGRNPNYPELVKANLHAQRGEAHEAERIYLSLLSITKNHPGIYFNIGMAFLNAGGIDLALPYFKKSLECCANYSPTLNVAKKYKHMR
jgi:tetratricopeptide (TPR) repeat protein